MIPAFYKWLLGRGFNTFSATAEIVVFFIYLTIIRRRRGDYRGIFTETKSR